MSRTNWLKSCDSTAECGSAFSCHCGVCTLPCADDNACAEIPGDDVVCTSRLEDDGSCVSATPICTRRCGPGNDANMCPHETRCSETALMCLSEVPPMGMDGQPEAGMPPEMGPEPDVADMRLSPEMGPEPDAADMRLSPEMGPEPDMGDMGMPPPPQPSASVFGIGGPGVLVQEALAGDAVYVVGHFDQPTDFGDGAMRVPNGGTAGFLAAYADDGSLTWLRIFGTEGIEIPDVSIGQLARDSAGNLYIAGAFTDVLIHDGQRLGDLGTGRNIFLLSFTSAGVPRPGTHAFMGLGNDSPLSLVADDPGNVYLGLQHGATLDVGADRFEGSGSAVVRFSGEPLAINWSVGFNTNATGNDLRLGIDPGTGRLAVIVNEPPPPPGLGDGDAVISALNPADGTNLWRRVIPRQATASARLSSVGVDGMGQVYAVGQFQQFQGDGLVIGPAMVNSTGGVDGLVVALDAAGGLRWHRPIGGIENDLLTTVHATSAGRVFVGGTFSQSVDFGTGDLVQSEGIIDGFALELNPDTNETTRAFFWAGPAGGPWVQCLDTDGDNLVAAILGSVSGVSRWPDPIDMLMPPAGENSIWAIPFDAPAP